MSLGDPRLETAFSLFFATLFAFVLGTAAEEVHGTGQRWLTLSLAALDGALAGVLRGLGERARTLE